MLCNECGESNILGAKFCQKCGAELVSGVKLAGLGDRIIAFFIDSLIVSVLAFLSGIVMGIMSVLGSLSTSDTSFVIANYLVGFLIFFGYFILLEGPLGGGQTIGKRILHIRVVREENMVEKGA